MQIDILGDICLSWSNKESYELENIALLINKQLGKADFRVANLEAPIINSEDIEPMPKEGIGSNLKMVFDKHKTFFQLLDVDAYTLANNHIGDYGENGIKETINFLNGINKKYVGTASKAEYTYEPIRICFDDIKISVFSFCENEFGIVRKGRLGAAGYNEYIIKEMISKERSAADKIIVIFHGGVEHYPFPTLRQQNCYRLLIDIGADIVIGMHSHCPVGMEYYKQGQIFYGIGNLYFPRQSPIVYSNWCYGYVVRLNILKTEPISSEIIPYSFEMDGSTWEKTDVNSFKKYFNALSKPIIDIEQLKNYYNGWVQYNGEYMYNILKQNLVKDQDKYCFNVVKNLFSCEAHNELICTYLNNKYYETDSDYSVYEEEIKKYINFNLKKVEKNFSKNEKAIVLWGITSKTFEKLKELDRKDNIIYLVDIDKRKQGFLLYGNLIHSPEYVLNNTKDTYFYIGTSIDTYQKIKKYLLNKGIDREHITLI